ALQLNRRQETDGRTRHHHAGGDAVCQLRQRERQQEDEQKLPATAVQRLAQPIEERRQATVRVRDQRVVRVPATIRRWVPVVSRVLIRRIMVCGIMVCRTVVRRWLVSVGGRRGRLVWRRWFRLVGVMVVRRKTAHVFSLAEL